LCPLSLSSLLNSWLSGRREDSRSRSVRSFEATMSASGSGILASAGQVAVFLPPQASCSNQHGEPHASSHCGELLQSNQGCNPPPGSVPCPRVCSLVSRQVRLGRGSLHYHPVKSTDFKSKGLLLAINSPISWAVSQIIGIS
jgi:hypothetical protein